MLSSKLYIKELIESSGFNVKKSLGQNFLVDAHALNKIVAAAELSADDVVIEIGPGMGVLTDKLAEKAGKVVAIEVDSHLLPVLQTQLAHHNNVEIVNQDILKADLADIIGGGRVKVVANLPYYITTPIMFRILEGELDVESMVLMMQKEVAERILASPRTKAYGMLSLTVAYYAEAAFVANVPPNAFIPRPNVSSAVLKLTPKGRKERPQLLFSIIKAAFANRRKTLVNCLSFGFDITKEQAKAALLSIGLPEDIRGEALNLEEFTNLACNFEKFVL